MQGKLNYSCCCCCCCCCCCACCAVPQKMKSKSNKASARESSRIPTELVASGAEVSPDGKPCKLNSSADCPIPSPFFHFSFGHFGLTKRKRAKNKKKKGSQVYFVPICVCFGSNSQRWQHHNATKCMSRGTATLPI